MDTLFDFIRGLGFHRGPDRLVAGICGGIARQFGLSVGLTRLVCLLLFLVPGIGLGLYLFVWVVTPNPSGAIPVQRFIDGWQGRN